METVPMPPSFYDDDIDKWKKKFAKSIKDRESTKQQMKRTQYITCLNRNINIKEGDTMVKSKSVKNPTGKP